MLKACKQAAGSSGQMLFLVDDEFFRGGALWGVEAEEVDAEPHGHQLVVCIPILPKFYYKSFLLLLGLP